MKKYIKKIYLSLFMSLLVLCASTYTYESLPNNITTEHEVYFFTFDGEDSPDVHY